MTIQQNNQNDNEKEVTITLQKWQVEYLLGAARMGIWVQHWSSNLAYNAGCFADTHAGKWMLNVGYIIDQIKKQTGIDSEYKEYGDSGFVENISKLVERQCKEWDDEHKKGYEEEHGSQQALPP